MGKVPIFGNAYGNQGVKRCADVAFETVAENTVENQLEVVFE
jgi:hypothetical protein